jgi:hypothetical protein
MWLRLRLLKAKSMPKPRSQRKSQRLKSTRS